MIERILFWAVVAAAAAATFVYMSNLANAAACAGGPRASYYWEGRRTASGERFNPSALTAAHRTWRFGTRARVTNRCNGRSVIVRINDRGPFVRGRAIDLSLGAARAIGMIARGVAPVKIERM